MQINQVTNNNFEGRVYFDKNLPNHLKNYADQLLDTVVDGQFVRDKLAKKTYDLTFFTTSSKKAVKPRLEFYSGFKVLNPKDKKYYNSRVRMDNNHYENAKKISNFIDRMEDAKKSYNGYNTLGERIKLLMDDAMRFLLDW